MTFLRWLTTLICLFSIHQSMGSTSYSCKALYTNSIQAIKKVPEYEGKKRYNPYRAGTSSHIGVSVRYSPSAQLRNQVVVDLVKPENFQQTGSRTFYYRVPYLNSPINFGKYYFHEVGLLAIYQNYGDLVDPKIVKTVIQAEKKLPLERQESYLIADRSMYISFAGGQKFNQEMVKGFVRVFNGSDYRSNTNRELKSDAGLPLERILSMSGKSTRIVEKMRSDRFHVYEIGKYFVRKSLSSQETTETKRGILIWLKDYIESSSDGSPYESYYFAHVASKIHRIAYERYFGLKPVSKEYSQGLDKDEDIMIIRGDELIQRIDRITSGP